MEVDIWGFFEKKNVDKVQVWLNSDKNTGSLHEDLRTFIIISRWILLRLGNVSDKSCREKKTHILCSVTLPKKMWTNMVQPESPQVRMECGAEEMRKDRHNLYQSLLIFHGNNGYADAPQCFAIINVKKGKAIPLQAWTGREGSRRLRLPDFKTVGSWGGKVVSPTHRPPLPPRKYSSYSFLLRAASTPGP
jgi:hypothetical protein